MKPQDQELANIAEAAKRVMNKETEVQPVDKDFVDLHSIDKGKRRGSTPLTEKDIDEANEFTKAAAKAAVAGDDEFEFDGKKFPTEMDVEVAKKILGESTDLDEAFIDVDTADPKSREFEKLLKKYRIKAKIITMRGPGGGMPLVKLSGKKKDLEGILKDPMGWQDDGFLAGFIEESLIELCNEKSLSIDEMSDEELDEMLEGILKSIGKKIGGAVKSRVTVSGRADRATKKADKLDKKNVDRERLKKAKDRIAAAKQKARDMKAKKSAKKESTEVKEGKFDKLKKKLKSINPETLGDVLNGKIKLSSDERKEFDSYMADAKKMFANLPKSSPIKTMFGKEFVKALESVDLDEAKFVSKYDKAIEKAKNKAEVLKIYPKAKFDKAYKSGGFAEVEKNLFIQYKWTRGKNFEVVRVYSKKGLNFGSLYLRYEYESTEIPPVKEGKVFEENYPKKLEKATTQADILKLYPKAKFSNRHLFGKPNPGGMVALSKTMALKFYFKDTDHRGTKMAKTDKFDVWSIWYYKPGERKPISLFGDFFKSK